MTTSQHLKKVKQILKSKQHFFDKCAAVSAFQDAWNLSERMAADLLRISKSEVHRMNRVASAPEAIRECAIKHNTDYHAVYKLMSCPREFFFELRNAIISGNVRTHRQAKRFIETSKDPKKSAMRDEFERIQKKYNNQVVG